MKNYKFFDKKIGASHVSVLKKKRSLTWQKHTIFGILWESQRG